MPLFQWEGNEEWLCAVSRFPFAGGADRVLTTLHPKRAIDTTGGSLSGRDGDGHWSFQARMTWPNLSSLIYLLSSNRRIVNQPIRTVFPPRSSSFPVSCKQTAVSPFSPILASVSTPFPEGPARLNVLWMRAIFRQDTEVPCSKAHAAML